MKIENLTIIFAVIIIPIAIVLSIYVNNKIEAEKLELTYDKRLFTATQDAVNAYQSNTDDDAFSGVTNSKILDIESTINIFFNSLASNFNFIGAKADTLKEYVPAVVFSLYDGYYVYSPFANTLTEVTSYDKDFSEDNDIIRGLKPYVYYTCRYTPNSNSDFFITYTLDNYITIQGKINDKYIYDCGFLYDIATSKGGKGIYFNASNKSYEYMGIEFSENNTEELKEYVGNKEYSYVKINGKKYYLDEDYYSPADRGNGSISLNNEKYIKSTSSIFFINDDGEKSYAQTRGYSASNSKEDNDTFIQYCNAIKNNKSSYEYFKHAYEFSRAVLGTPVAGYQDKAKTEINNGYGLQNLIVNDSIYYKNSDSLSGSSGITSFKSYGDGNRYIFQDSNYSIENENSNFNAHRKNVIRYVIETNLSTSIAGYKDNTNSDIDYLMPKISETDWENIQNEVCVISFFQGMSVGSKIFNSYKVVPNSYTSEHVDEDDIYLLKNDNTYCKVNDSTLNKDNLIKNLGYYPGILKKDFTMKKLLEPVDSAHPELGNKTTYYSALPNYRGSYTSIVGDYNSSPLGGQDIYQFIGNNSFSQDVKRVYLVSLARERWGGFNVNNINYEIYGNNGNEYFLQDY